MSASTTDASRATQAAQAAYAVRSQHALERVLAVVSGEKKVIGRAAPLLFLIFLLPWLMVDPGSSVLFWHEVAVRYLNGLLAVPDWLYWGGIGLLSVAPPAGWFLLKKRWREFGLGPTSFVFLLLAIWNVAVNFIGAQWGLQWASPGLTFSREVLAGVFTLVLVISFGFEEVWQLCLFEMVGRESLDGAASAETAPRKEKATKKKKATKEKATKRRGHAAPRDKQQEASS